MSHFLTRLAGRALEAGAAPAVEPVRSPLFNTEHSFNSDPNNESLKPSATGSAHGGITEGNHNDTTSLRPGFSSPQEYSDSPDANARAIEEISNPQRLLNDDVDVKNIVSAPVPEKQETLRGLKESIRSVGIGLDADGHAASEPAGLGSHQRRGQKSTLATASENPWSDSADGTESAAISVIAKRYATEETKHRNQTTQKSSTSELKPRGEIEPGFHAQHIMQGAAKARENTAHTQQPTIKITIGRIDVRAVTPPAPAVRPRAGRDKKRQPSLSLDDYLKQRSGGRR